MRRISYATLLRDYVVYANDNKSHADSGLSVSIESKSDKWTVDDILTNIDEEGSTFLSDETGPSEKFLAKWKRSFNGRSGGFKILAVYANRESVSVAYDNSDGNAEPDGFIVLDMPQGANIKFKIEEHIPGRTEVSIVTVEYDKRDITIFESVRDLESERDLIRRRLWVNLGEPKYFMYHAGDLLETDIEEYYW